MEGLLSTGPTPSGFTKKNFKQNVSACGRFAQSRVKKISQCKALALYKEKHFQRCSSDELLKAAVSYLESRC